MINFVANKNHEIIKINTPNMKSLDNHNNVFKKKGTLKTTNFSKLLCVLHVTKASI